MIREAIEKIQSIISTGITGCYVSRYKGEFEEGVDWNPQFPCVMTALHSYKPINTAADGTVLSDETRIILYIADRDINASSALDTVENVLKLTDGKDIEYMVVTTKARAHVSVAEEGLIRQGYAGAGVEIYTLVLRLT